MLIILEMLNQGHGIQCFNRYNPSDICYTLMNILKEDQHFDKIKIDVKSVDKMTDNQQVAFVKDFFLKH